MMRLRSRFSLFFLILAVAIVSSVAVAADREHRAPRMTTTARTIEWQTAPDLETIVLSVQRPDGEVVNETFAAGLNPILGLDGLADGLYSYELRTQKEVQSGSFTIANGTVISPSKIERS